MRNAMLAVLGHDAGGLAFAAALAGTGALAAMAGAPTLACAALVLAGVLLGAGALRHLWLVRRAEAAHRPPGRLVDVGGFRLHVRADGSGDGAGRPPVVWFAGGHGSGALMLHLHRALEAHTRSILIDRAGTGYSDTGPFPRSTAREMRECWAALDAAGERGPFVLAGHSFGGLLAAAMARHRPEAVAALVLLDATPPDTIVYGPRLSALREMRRGALLAGVLRAFGLHESPLERAQRKAAPQVFDAMARTLGADAMAAERALGIRTRGMLSAASIYAELSAEGMARAAWESATYDGDLGDMPVYVVAPGDSAEVESLPELTGASAGEAERMRRVIRRTRERYLSVSTRARRVIAPPGTGHNFPYEVPTFVAGVVMQVVDEVRSRPPGAA